MYTTNMITAGYRSVFCTRTHAHRHTSTRPIVRTCMCQFGNDLQKYEAFRTLLHFLHSAKELNTNERKTMRKRLRQYMVDMEPDLDD